MHNLDVVGLASSEPEYQTKAGGVGAAKHYLFQALARKVNLLEVFQPTPTAAAIAAAQKEVSTLGGDLRARHRTIKRHPEIFRSKSADAERHVGSRKGRLDLIFQWEFFFSPRTSYCSPEQRHNKHTPYVVYNDWTTRLTQQEFPDWADTSAYEPFHELQVPLLQNAEKVFLFSDKARQSVIHDYGVREDRAITVRTGVNLPIFPSQQPKKYDEQNILFIGNDYKAKGLTVLLAAFFALSSDFPDAQLTIVGDPAGFVVPKHPQVRCVGIVQDAATLDELFRRSTIFALPSQMEAFGHVYAEAMAHQLACLGSSVGAVPEIVLNGQTGLIAPPDDTRGWVDNLRLLLASPDLRQRYGQRGYAEASRKYQWDQVVGAMLPHIEAIKRPRP